VHSSHNLHRVQFISLEKRRVKVLRGADLHLRCVTIEPPVEVSANDVGRVVAHPFPLGFLVQKMVAVDCKTAHVLAHTMANVGAADQQLVGAHCSQWVQSRFLNRCDVSERRGGRRR
jgi:hypothetical protein